MNKECSFQRLAADCRSRERVKTVVCGLTLKLKKCVFAAESIEYLGHSLSSEGVRPDERLCNPPKPAHAHEVKRFVHLAGYSRNFIEGFRSIEASMTKLLKKDVGWEWTEEKYFAFARIRC
ncbi:LOW QUALITY PROTEIN: Gag/polymerase/env Polyprotein [Phytophthora megakarya]|uniref:Gag/polymerase/env Polyprotein n=1 Tax=Phytophthora megakarya TaxID=4795 RepID=A0A225V2U7_9STRA|nr:LOW QUALITY PROTEIN: Gag/polymerase/env Polyprotein [Phytophthora megakarya]